MLQMMLMKWVRRKLHQCVSELMKVSAFFLCLVMDNTFIFEYLSLLIIIFCKCDALIKSYTSKRCVLNGRSVLKELL